MGYAGIYREKFFAAPSAASEDPSARIRGRGWAEAQNCLLTDQAYLFLIFCKILSSVLFRRPKRRAARRAGPFQRRTYAHIYDATSGFRRLEASGAMGSGSPPGRRAQGGAQLCGREWRVTAPLPWSPFRAVPDSMMFTLTLNPKTVKLYRPLRKRPGALALAASAYGCARGPMPSLRGLAPAIDVQRLSWTVICF